MFQIFQEEKDLYSIHFNKDVKAYRRDLEGCKKFIYIYCAENLIKVPKECSFFYLTNEE